MRANQRAGSKNDSENHSWTQILLSKSQREKAKKFHFVIFEALKITWKQNFEKLDQYKVIKIGNNARIKFYFMSIFPM